MREHEPLQLAVVQRLAVVAGLMAWLVVGFAALTSYFAGGYVLWWWLAWAAYGVLFLLIVYLPGGSLRGSLRTMAFVALVALGVAVCVLNSAGGFNVAILVVTAVCIAEEWPPRVGLLVVVGQSLLLGVALLPRGISLWSAVVATVSFCAFQLLAFVMVVMTAAADDARAELLVANAELARANADLERAHDELQEAQELLVESSRVQERLCLSRELHDRVGHQLTALAVNLEVAQHLSRGEAHRHVVECRDIAKDLLCEVRGVVGALRATPGDLRAELSALGEHLPSLQVQVQVADDVRIDGPAAVSALIRCAQEAVTNAARHGGADQVWIAVEELAGSVTLMARDDGRGCAKVTPGHGLTGMRERFHALGGEVSWSTSPGRGFHVQASVPASATGVGV